MEQNFILSINYEGTDYQVQVDSLETANMLLNDSQAARQYVESIMQKKSDHGNDLVESDQSHQVPLETGEGLSSQDLIWSRKKPTQQDIQATKSMLTLRENLKHLFDDKKTKKLKLWKDLAKELKLQGYNLGGNGGERCRQKFANLQKAYLSYISNQVTTGSEVKDVPPFFEEMHGILGMKHKVMPKMLEDSMHMAPDEISNAENNVDESMEIEKESVEESIEDLPDAMVDPQPLTSKGISSRFKKNSRKMKPSKNHELLLELKQDRKERKEQFEVFSEHLKKTEEQRGIFLKILQNAFASKKRKRESSSDDSSN